MIVNSIFAVAKILGGLFGHAYVLIADGIGTRCTGIFFDAFNRWLAVQESPGHWMTRFSGLHVPEELGGQGASARETSVVLEELGRSVSPVPFLVWTARKARDWPECRAGLATHSAADAESATQAASTTGGSSLTALRGTPREPG